MEDTVPLYRIVVRKGFPNASENLGGCRHFFFFFLLLLRPYTTTKDCVAHQTVDVYLYVFFSNQSS